MGEVRLRAGDDGGGCGEGRAGAARAGRELQQRAIAGRRSAGIRLRSASGYSSAGIVVVSRQSRVLRRFTSTAVATWTAGQLQQSRPIPPIPPSTWPRPISIVLVSARPTLEIWTVCESRPRTRRRHLLLPLAWPCIHFQRTPDTPR